MKYGDSTKAAIVSRGLKELARAVVALGEEKQILYGLLGSGNLMVTYFSRHSRNRDVDQVVGEWKSPTETGKTRNDSGRH